MTAVRRENNLPEPRLPLEVCESVIDRVHHPSLFDHHATRYSCAALSKCSLVCRAWRPRAQKLLFYAVELRTTYLLYAFVELLDESPALATYVHVVLIHGSTHYTPGNSVFPLFPTVLARKLPNLQEMSVYGTGIKSGRSLKRGWSPRIRVRGRKTKLPHLPLHPLFHTLLDKLRQLTTLRLGVLTFPSFGDFARILHQLTGLQSLVCDALDWSNLGLVPLCTSRLEAERSKFLPALCSLKVTWMGLCGTERLFAGLGPSLTRLDIHVPYFIPHATDGHDASEVAKHAIDLSPFPLLYSLTVRLSPALQQPEYQQLYLAMLRSWSPAPSTSGRTLAIAPDWPSSFTERQYCELMDAISSPTEDALFPTAQDHRHRASGPGESSVVLVNVPRPWGNWGQHKGRKGKHEGWFPRAHKLHRVRLEPGRDPPFYPWEHWRRPAATEADPLRQRTETEAAAQSRVREVLATIRAEKVTVPCMLRASNS
ncbi:hypothetical protein K466DRAFT_525725 [Polyporus arcularius HHB13444]|uniref:F-box domain-containing protein n=1 Tax=Polyporus arcularius HHB13444 TaxID=1314778 RepID=A0A5C3P763_9APHY|nr:hypothetical protein K466DRAFT_525725 [Polyporus arcularius HHB13444]